MKWITWEKVGVDRMGCAWLIKRFIDTQAEFQFVAPDQKTLPEDAKAFDIPGVRLSHQHGHCSFHTILREYHLNDSVLEAIARIVDEADIVQALSVEPAAFGLDIICQGIRLTSPDDHIALERGYLIYEALYAQLSANI